MDDSDYDAAIRQEAALLDQQLVQYVIDALSARQLGGNVTLSASVTAAIDAAFANAAQNVVPATANTTPSTHSPGQGSVFDSVPDKAESAISLVQAPGQSGDGLPTGSEILDNIVAPVKIEPLADKRRPPWTHVAILLSLLAAIGFGGWQMIRATGNKAAVDEAATRKEAIKDAQTDLDNALCAAGYPAVIRAIEAKSANNEERSDTEKTVSIFSVYRQNVAKANGSPVRALPLCPAEAEGEE